MRGFLNQEKYLITVINLSHYLSGQEDEKSARDLFIVTNFNKMTVAFRVQSIEGISRICLGRRSKSRIRRWQTAKTVSATGIAQCEGQLVTILDFEKIVAEISPETTIQIMQDVESMGDRPICDAPIVIAEDSVLLKRMINDCLERAGFVRITNFSSGQEAWDYLSSIADARKYCKR